MNVLLHGKTGVGRFWVRKSEGMLAFIRKLSDGRLAYLFALNQDQQAEMAFDDHGQAFDFAMSIGIDFVHQPWSPDVERRIYEHLGFSNHTAKGIT